MPVLQTILITLLCLLLSAKAGAIQEPPLGGSFRNLTYRDGLGGTSVTDIMADHNGEMWLSTSGGVNNYNGRRLVMFRLGSEPRRNFVYHIYEDSLHRILATSQHGIFRMNYGDGEFRRIVPEVSTAEVLLPWTGDSLFIGNCDGLHLYDGRKLATFRVADTPMDMANSVRDVRRGPDGRVWFVSKQQLNALSPATGRVESWDVSRQMPPEASLSRMAFCGSKCYIGTKNHGLYVYNLADRSLRRIEGPGNVVTSLKADGQGHLCVGTDGSGAFLIDTATDSIVRHFRTDTDERDRIVSNAVYCYFRDGNGVDWYGYFRFGLTHTFHIEPLFRPWGYKVFTTKGISVRSYCLGTEYSLIGTADGFFFIDPARDIVRHVTPAELGGGHIVTSMVRYGDYYYIATYDGGLRRFDPQTLAVSKLPVEQDFDQLCVTKQVVNPLLNTLDIGTNQGLFVLRQDGSLAHFNESNSRLGGGTVIDMGFDAQALGIWLSTQAGLTRYDQRTAQFQQGFPEGFFQGEKSLRIANGHDSLLFFYNTDDIFYTDPGLRHFGRLALPKLMDRELCLAFADDCQGHYWVSNERGLFCFDYGLKHMQYFGESEGLLCQFITDGSLQADSAGRLWVATSNGLFCAHLDEIEQWRQRARNNLLLYQLRIAGVPQTEALESRINDRRAVTLTWNFGSERLEALPVSTDYSRSAGRIFEYRVDHSGQWQVIADEEPLVVSNLLIGRHTLSIRISGLAGTEKDYAVTVVPSAVAIIELLLLVVAIVLLVWWYRYRKNTQLLLSERDTIEEALVEMEQEQQQSQQAEEKQKYEKVRINESECEIIVRRMRLYIEQNKPYQNPDLKMSDLAEVMQLSPSKLSQVFNLYLNESYYEFINNYRLEEFKRRLAVGDGKRFTLIALSEQCGFKKSSFFATFRRVEGMTPTEYMKKGLG